MTRICAEYVPERLKDETLKLSLWRNASISSQKHLEPLHAIYLLIKFGADPNLKDSEGSDPKKRAYFVLKITLGIEIDLLNSNNVAWHKAKFAPWHSSFELRCVLTMWYADKAGIWVFQWSSLFIPLSLCYQMATKALRLGD
jgi:hypothetical protein